MTSSEEFKQAIRAGNISEAFLVAMSNAPQLNITTKIITADGEQTEGSQDVGSQLDNYLHTHINLIEGKVENEIGEQLTGDRYTEIKQFHLRQVTQGHKTIQRNLISLQKMFQLMSAFQQLQTSDHGSWVDIAANVARESLPAEPDANQIHGAKATNALQGGTVTTKEEIAPDESVEEMNYSEPQLPSFDEDEAVVDDLLSLADIDDDSDDDLAQSESENQEDWGEWLDEEPQVDPKVFDLKSLNIREATAKWSHWEPPKNTEETNSAEESEQS
ncbi:MAG: hypothetical protein AAFQ80_01460 [Cyanobacteria bacterium J06621_8]